MPINKMDKPIPGENYTRDTKNLPWHRPPEHTDLDKALEAVSKKIFEKNSMQSMIVMLEEGATVVDLTQVLLMSGIAAGKWTLDFALLMAGPTAHMIYIMAKGNKVDCELGISDKGTRINREYMSGLKEQQKVSSDKIKPVISPRPTEYSKAPPAVLSDMGERPPGGMVGMSAAMESGGIADEEPVEEMM